MSSTASIPLRMPALPIARRRSEAGLFLAAIAVIALHVIDDNFLQPPAGTGPTDHLVSGLVPLALLGLGAWAYPRLTGAARGALSLFFGVFGAATAAEAVHYTRTLGASGDDFTGLLAIPAALLLLGLGLTTLWRTRRCEGGLAWRYTRRLLLGVAAAAVAALIVFPIALGYVTTHTARSVVPANHLGVAYEDVTFTTSDGLELRGWYIPSKNGAAVISFPGRNGPQRPARVLARHGYGVLLFDRRGEGVSEGAPHAYGWGGDRDIKAAIDYLQQRPDVDPERIGGIGLSVGGEMMIEAAAETSELKAIVSEGAGARSYNEDRHHEVRGVDKVLAPVLSGMRTAALAVFSNESPPADLADLAARAAQPMLLIAAPNSPHGEQLNRVYHESAGENSTLWEIPESTHVGGITARPEEYERRVVGFFDRTL